MSQLHYLELRFKPNQYLNEIYSGIEEVDQQQFVIGFTEDSKLRNILLSLKLPKEQVETIIDINKGEILKASLVEFFYYQATHDKTENEVNSGLFIKILYSFGGRITKSPNDKLVHKYPIDNWNQVGKPFHKMEFPDDPNDLLIFFKEQISQQREKMSEQKNNYGTVRKYKKPRQQYLKYFSSLTRLLRLACRQVFLLQPYI